MAFKSNKEVTKHKQKHNKLSHSGEKPFHCSLFQKAFQSNSDLTVHKQRHSGEKECQNKLI